MNSSSSACPAASLGAQREAIIKADRAIHAWVAVASSMHQQDLTGGPLSGLFFGVKDVIDVAGLPTRCGSDITSALAAKADAVCVQMLRDAGAMPIGKTVTAEFAHVTPGPTRNPANVLHTPGGSSSGSAAAVAAGMVPFALGTQTGGSIIRPASFCGVVGFKPTFGVVSRTGMRVMCPSLDVIGWHAQDVEVAERVGSVLLPGDAACNGPLAPPRIGVISAHPGGQLAPSALQALHDARDRLCAAGYSLVTVPPPHQPVALLEAHGILAEYELARTLSGLDASARARLSARLQETVERGRNVSLSTYRRASALRAAASASWSENFPDCDLILTTGALGPAPSGLHHTGLSGFNKAWSVLGWPCLHLPTTATPTGLPLGVMLVARPSADLRLLRWARALHPTIDRREARQRATSTSMNEV